MATPTLEQGLPNPVPVIETYTHFGNFVVQRRPLQVGERIPVEPAYPLGPKDALFLQVYSGRELGFVKVEKGQEIKFQVGAVAKDVKVTRGRKLLQERVVTR